MKLRPFELALVVIFLALAILALVVASNFDGKSSDDSNLLPPVGKVTIWGTLPAEGIEKVLADLIKSNDDAYRSVSYKYFNPNEFDTVLLNALADNTGPDLVIASQEKLTEMRRRIQPVSYESFPIRDIRTLYIDGAQIFALSDGLYGYPIAVDPLMMFWNRDILGTEGYLEAPRTWESLVNTMFPKLIQRDFDRTIRRSVVAMGEYSNVRNAFGVISALVIQGGSQRVVEDGKSGYTIKLQLAEGGGADPLRAAADFYTRFSKPSNTLYSWNRAFGEDRQQFTSGDLALYFGYGSEGRQIEKINPNLNFDIAEIPQGGNSTTRRTYGKFYALSMLKSSENKNGAALVMSAIGSSVLASEIAINSNMVPAHRASVVTGSNDTYGRITYQSAPIALGWLNPKLTSANQIFETMTRDINENRNDLTTAVSDVSVRLGNEY